MALIQDTVTGDVFDGEETTAMIADVRYAGIPLWKNADLEVSIDMNFANEKQGQTVDADDSVMLTASLNQNLARWLQQNHSPSRNSGYAEQMTTFGTGKGIVRDANNNDAEGFRLINWGVLAVGENIEFGHTVRYAMSTGVGANNSDDDSLALSFVRFTSGISVCVPSLKLAEFVETINNQDSAGGKFTVAQVSTAKWALVAS